MDDYIKLFSNILDRNTIEPRLDLFIDNILVGLLADPDDTQNKLEELADAFPHYKTYERLLMFYNLRNEKDKYVVLFNKYYAITQTNAKQVLLEKYVSIFSKATIYYWRNSNFNLSILENYFNSSPIPDIALGIKIANGYSNSNKSKSIEIFKTLLKLSPPQPQITEILDSLLDYYYDVNEIEEGMSLMREYYTTVLNNDNLKIHYLQYLSKRNNIDELLYVINDSKFNSDSLAYHRPEIIYEIYSKLNLTDLFKDKINSLLINAINNEEYKKVVDLGRVYEKINLREYFEAAIKNSQIPRRVVEDIIRDSHQPF